MDLFWRSLAQRLYRIPITGGAIVEIPDAGAGAFGVTPDAILTDFTRWGFRAIAR